MDERKLTIVLTMQNGVEGLAKTFESLRQQKEKAFQLILVCAPKDRETVEKEALSSFHAKLIESDANMRGALLNQAMQYVDTTYVMFMETGDTMNHHFIKKAMKVMEENPAATFVVGKSYCNNPLMTKTRKQHILSKLFIEEDTVYDLSQEYSALHTALDSSIFHSEMIKRIGFNETLPFEAGTDMVMKLLLENRFMPP